MSMSTRLKDVMRERKTGDPRTCPLMKRIFLCKYCGDDLKCGEIITQMTEEEIKELYSFLKSEAVR